MNRTWTKLLDPRPSPWKWPSLGNSGTACCKGSRPITAESVEMRLQGHTYEEIGTVLNLHKGAVSPASCASNCSSKIPA